MKLKQQKKRILLLAGAFLALLIVYFAVIVPLTAETEDDSPAVELMDGEVLISKTLTNFYMFEPIKRASMQSIEVSNAYGGYKIYRDASDTFQLDGFLGLSFDQELFASLVVTTGTPTVMERVAVDLDEEGLAQYGLAEPQASWTVTDLNGNKVTVYVGDQLITEGGYYTMLEGRNAVYIMSYTLADTILQPAYALLQPILTAGMTQSNYYYVTSFTLWHDEELFLNVERVPEAEMEDPDNIVETRLLYPHAADGSMYEINDTLYYEVLYKFIAMEGESAVAFLPTDEELASFGLDDPAYTIRFTFDDPNTTEAENYEYVLFVSAKQADGSYYAVSNMLSYALVCQVSSDNLGWLESSKFAWLFPTPFFENIKDVDRLTVKSADGAVDVDFRLTHGTNATDGTALLDVTEVNSDTTIPNKDVKNFREYYKTMLNITNQEYATLSEADRIALTSSDENLIMTMTYEGKNNYCEYKFYRYVEDSTGKISGGKVFVTVNGIGEFYTSNDLVEKVLNDTSRVLKGLDVDPYGHN